jgi:hypothetical protein
MQMLAMDKHSYLFFRNISGEEKKLYKIDAQSKDYLIINSLPNSLFAKIYAGLYSMA